MEQQFITIPASFLFSRWENPDRSFCVYQYRNNDTQAKFYAVGAELPNVKNVPVNLTGTWEKRKGTGEKQFRVMYTEVVQADSEEQFVAYIVSLKVPRFGKAKAKRVYAKFGRNVWQVIDFDPDSLIKVFTVSKKNIESLKEALARDNVKRDLNKFFSNAGVVVSGETVREMVKKYGDDTLKKLKENPFLACSLPGYPFDKADIVAESLNFPKNSIFRLKAAAFLVLDREATSGHVCVPYEPLIRLHMKATGCTYEECTAALKEMIRDKELVYSNKFIYSKDRFDEECTIAREIVRLMQARNYAINDVDAFIDEYERDNLKLAEKQREAVREVFRSNVSIITGGPGVGKTTVTKAILATHAGIYGASSEPILLAPTGKAARRMSEATGYPAQTIHSAIGWTGDDRPVNETPLPGNLILIDECSMMDQKIASLLLKCVETGSRVVFIGDVDQLPSVGCGNVLRDMIISGVVPTTLLDVIYRQAGTNPIITNSHAVNGGKTDLVYNEDFLFIQTSTDEQIFKGACRMYLKFVKEYGIDNVILLNPQRQNTDISVDRFNKTLQEVLNPAREGVPEITFNKRTFRKGDRVIELKNTEYAKNGDVGVIVDITKRADDPESPNDFEYFAVIEWNGDGRSVEYNAEDLKHVDLAYCTTVHKAQGSEYENVIEVISKEHRAMLKRNMVYTAMTRAKKRFVGIGEEDALHTAIRTIDNSVRYTNLASRIYLLNHQNQNNHEGEK